MSRFVVAATHMAEPGITKLDAAQRQLDCAIWLRLKGMDSLAVHTLAYAAYGILRDLCRDRPEVREMIEAIIDHTEFAKVPSFLKHADYDPEGMLDAHSPETVHLTVALTIRLWKELGREVTPAMSEFNDQLGDPYEPAHRASEGFRYLRDSPPLADRDPTTRMADLQKILNSPST
jgi:hypothetical protein